MLLIDVDVIDRGECITTFSLRDPNQLIEVETQLLCQMHRFYDRNEMGEKAFRAMRDDADAAIRRAFHGSPLSKKPNIRNAD